VKLRYPREFHSMCALSSSTIFFTGSRIPNSANKVEYYDNIERNIKVTKDLNEGRSRHSSCGFKGRYVFIFAGFAAPGDFKNSIERYDLRGKDEWTLIKSLNSKITACINPGVLQVS